MDMEKAVKLEQELEIHALHGKKKIFFDFSDVEFLCSYIMRVFIKFDKTWSRGGIKMGIQYINDYSNDTIKMAGMEKLFTLKKQWKEECNLT